MGILCNKESLWKRENWKYVFKLIWFSYNDFKNTAKDRILYSQDRHVALHHH